MSSTLRRTKLTGWYEYYREVCPICNRTGGCMRNEEGDTVVCIRVPSEKLFSNKFTSYLHFLDENKGKRITEKWEEVKQHKKLDSQLLNMVYRNLLLSKLSLTNDHLQHLTSANRGLTLEQVKVRGYKSLTWDAIKNLSFPNSNLGGVPGLYKDNNGQWRLHGMQGILIPYRNNFNEIIGFQIRTDNPRNDVSIDKKNFPLFHDDTKVQFLNNGEIIGEKQMKVGETVTINHEGQTAAVKLKNGMRYFWLSSAKKTEGCGAGDPSPIHVAVPSHKLSIIESSGSDVRTSIKADSVWVTEGALKADIAADHIHKAFTKEQIDILGDTILALPGVNTWASVLPILKEMKVKQVHIAFDMDFFSNDDVKRNLLQFVEALKQENYQINYVVWNSKDAKGLDDLFISGKKPQVRRIQ